MMRGRSQRIGFEQAALLVICFALAAALGLVGASDLVSSGLLSRGSLSKSVVEAAGGSFDTADIEPYAGKPACVINGDKPFFTAEELARDSFEDYAPLDRLYRCGAAFALVGTETMPTQKRESIGDVRPSGWQIAKYSWVDGRYLYNRCHLIGYQLTGENANANNLITGTRYLNVEGMEPFESQVAQYVQATGNHVLYRVTPVFEDNDLVARGVLMEAQSVEDGGRGITFCRWCYNVQPGVEIDYATGVNRADGTISETEGAGEGPAAGAEETPSSRQTPSSAGAASNASAQGDAPGASASADNVACNFILNKNSYKFHRPDCPSVNDMSEKNKIYFNGTRDEAIADGYVACRICNP